MTSPSRPPVRELVVLRGMACLGVVLIHALSTTLVRAQPQSRFANALSVLQMLLMFCTPVFVFLSAAVVGYAYDAPPPGFLRRRVRYVLVPFVVMGAIYGAVTTLTYLHVYDTSAAAASALLQFTIRNLAGGNHLWFIIPIFQFYILYTVCGRWLTDAPPRVVLPSALLLNAAYLALFNLARVDDAGQAALGTVGSRHVWSLLFPGWLFYFAYGHWLGRSWYKHGVGRLPRLAWHGVVAALAAGTMLYLHFGGVLAVRSSQRVDVLLYTAAMMPLLLWVAGRVRWGTGVLVTISRFSFGIYILHPFFIDVARRVLRTVPAVELRLNPLLLWVFATGGALATAWLLSRVPAGSLLVGRPFQRSLAFEPADAAGRRAVLGIAGAEYRHLR